MPVNWLLCETWVPHIFFIMSTQHLFNLPTVCTVHSVPKSWGDPCVATYADSRHTAALTRIKICTTLI